MGRLLPLPPRLLLVVCMTVLSDRHRSLSWSVTFRPADERIYRCVPYLEPAESAVAERLPSAEQNIVQVVDLCKLIPTVAGLEKRETFPLRLIVEELQNYVLNCNNT